MKVKKLPLSHFVNLMKRGEPFSFSRWGDGEWLTTLGFVGRRNSNGCTFTQALCDDLRRVLKAGRPYYHGVLRVALAKKRFYDINDPEKVHEFDSRQRIDKWLMDNGVTIEWINGDVLLDQALKGNLFPLIEQIRTRRVLYVGNERLRSLNLRGAGFFPYVAYVQPPPQNAHAVKDKIRDEVMREIKRHRVDFIGWSCGLAGKVLIDEVYYLTGGEVTQIDFGSSFDGYFSPLDHVNKAGSRSYIRKGNYNWAALREVNTGRCKRKKGETFKK